MSKQITLAVALIATLALAACGGGGGGGSSTGVSSGSGSGSSSGSGGSTTAATCDQSSGSTATSITPCVTITGLSSGSTITVTDYYAYSSGAGTSGANSVTESTDGTYTFPAVQAITSNGSADPGLFPAISFSFTVSGSAKCANESASGSYHAEIACGAFPSVSATVPTVETMPGVATPTVIGTPDIVPVMFNASSAGWTTGNQSNDLAFLRQFTASKVWGLLDQYGVGSATVDPTISVTNLTSTEASALLKPSGVASYVQNNASTWDPGLTGSTVFMIYMPPNVYFEPGTQGYTGRVTVNSETVTYAVVTDDYNPGQVYGSGQGPYISAEAALVDAVTNPTGTDGYAWMSTDTDVWMGFEEANGITGQTNLDVDSETVGVGTLCSGVMGGSGVSPVNFPDISISAILPLWSNSDASAGRNPCEPEISLASYTSGSVTLSDPASNFVGAVEQTPSEADSTGTLGGMSRTDHAVQIQPGQTVDVTFTFFTTQPVSGTNSTGSGIPVQGSIVGYIDGTNGAQPVVNGYVNDNQNSPALLTVGTIKNLTRSGADGYALNGDSLEVPVTASSAAFSGMYVITIDVSGVPVSMPVGVTEGSTWK